MVFVPTDLRCSATIQLCSAVVVLKLTHLAVSDGQSCL